jgi:DhnA family fructose-bisphosphate aldolase class Ia
MNTKFARLNRLFNTSGNCFDVAIDHGFFNEFSFLEGIEDIHLAIERIIKANPDAIQLSVGQAEVLQKVAGKNKPSLVLRTDIANCYGDKKPDFLYSALVEDAVEQALVLDAACVVVNLLQLPGEPELHKQCIDNINRLKPVCDRYGMPLMIEPLVMQPNEVAGGYMVDGDIKKIISLVRQSVELGADIIKADPCDNPKEYHKVIRASRVPILVRGGGKASEEEIFSRTIELINQGARGIVYGRNIIQHSNPKGITQAFMSIVHDNADVDRAMEILKQEQ